MAQFFIIRWTCSVDTIRSQSKKNTNIKLYFDPDVDSMNTYSYHFDYIMHLQYSSKTKRENSDVFITVKTATQMGANSSFLIN